MSLIIATHEINFHCFVEFRKGLQIKGHMNCKKFRTFFEKIECKLSYVGHMNKLDVKDVERKDTFSLKT
jgi:hypothetical protein